MLPPTAVGGMGLNPVQVNMVMEKLGWGSFGLAVWIGSGVSIYLLKTDTNSS